MIFEALLIVAAILCVSAIVLRISYLVVPDDDGMKGRHKLLRTVTGKRHVVLFLIGTQRRVEKVLDEVHMRGPEIEEHKAHLSALKNVAGNSAEEERELLEKAIEELYATPLREAEIDGDAYVAFIRPRLKELAARREEADRAFFDGRAKKLAELNNG